MKITVSIDTGDWAGALDELVALCRAHSKDASVEAAGAIQTRTRILLLEKDHPPHTRTPSVRGEPPASIFGTLADSVIVDEHPSEGEAEVGPTTDYGRIQELRGFMQGHPYMRWIEDGRVHYSRGHSLPKRPYLRPATDDVIRSGELTAIYYKHWAEAQAEATR